MNKARWVSAAVGTAVLVAGFALPASAALADSGPNGDGGVLSILSGNTVNAPVSAPSNVCGIALAMLGFSNAGCKGGSASYTTVNGSGSGGGNGNAGVLSEMSGNTLNAPVSAPMNTCGISLAMLGFSNAGCQGGSVSVVNAPPTGSTPPPSCQCTPPGHHKHHHDHTPPPGGGQTSPPGNGGTPPGSSGGGTTTTVPGSLPITGADLLGMGIAAAGALGIGGTALVVARRRRNSEV